MTDVLVYTTKETHTVEKKKLVPFRPRKYNVFYSISDGANAISFVSSDITLSQLYDKKSESTYMDQCFRIISCIGEGSFGVVYKVRSLEDGQFYAVKKSRERFKNSSDRKRKLREVERLEKLPSHTNCVKLHCAWEEAGYLFLQIELCESSLAMYTRSHHFITEEMVWNVLTDITLALKHLHDRNVMHLDIKLDNILMASDGSFKLSDFGIAMDCSQILKDTLEGDSKYVAPELLSENFTKSADIFSLGISMLELSFDLNLPPHGASWHLLRQGQIPHFQIRSVTNDLFELMKWMMHPEPEKRPTADMILKHGLVKKRLALRSISRVLQCLAEPGKLLVSFLSFFGKVGYDIIMAAVMRLRAINQNPSALSLHQPAAILNDDVHESDVPAVVTSTPVTARSFESNNITPTKLDDSWEISSCFDASMDYDRQNEPSSTDRFKTKEATGSNCKCHKIIRMHPYKNKCYPKMCSVCGGRKCSIVRNLIDEFSQCDKKA